MLKVLDESPDRTGSSFDGKVRVIARMRPLLPHESSSSRCVFFDGESLQLKMPTSTISYEYKFDGQYDETSTQKQIFDNEIAPILESVFRGVHTTVFAYGHTGAGKTFTMQGSDTDSGVIPRAVEALFAMVHKGGGSHMRAHVSPDSDQVYVSYLEIYNEKVYDLLELSDTDLPVREDAMHRILVPDLAEVPLRDFSHFQMLYERGCRNRKTAATRLNAGSSRSHAVLVIKVVRKDGPRLLTGKLHLIDLAGSEDNRRTDNRGARVTESGHINKSLFVLGQVVSALNQRQKRIPYRDSKLTRLLQDSLGGSSRAVMIANLSPSVEFYNDTLNTLNFATRSNRIVNDVAVHAEEPAAAAPTMSEADMRARLDEWRTKKDPFLAAKRKSETGTQEEASFTSLLSKAKSFVASKPTAVAPAAAVSFVNKENVDGDKLKHAAAGLIDPSTLKEMQKRLESIEQRLTVSRPQLAPPAMTPEKRRGLAARYAAEARQAAANLDTARAVERYQKALEITPDDRIMRQELERLRGTLRTKPSAKPTKPTTTTAAATAVPKPERMRARHTDADSDDSDTDDDWAPEPFEEVATPVAKPQRMPKKRMIVDDDDAVAATAVAAAGDEVPVVRVPKAAKSKKAAAAAAAATIASDEAAPTLTTAAADDAAEQALSLLPPDVLAAYEQRLLESLNNATKKELQKLECVGAKTADTILQFRESGRLFHNLDEVKYVGLKGKTLDKFRSKNLAKLHSREGIATQ